MAEMTLKEFQSGTMAERINNYKGKIFIIFTGYRENIRLEALLHCSVAIIPIKNDLYEVAKNKHNGKIATLKKPQLEEVIQTCKQKGYLIVGEENIK